MNRIPKKILMATMSMGIGGAETHILELSRQLVADGYEIAVISNGGVYVDKLISAGIKHINAPLNDRKSMLSGYAALRRAIEDFKPDIVHAHARIPALLCSIICKRMHIPLLTSVHGKYEVTPLLRLMTRWGDRCLVVSEDLKDYLTNGYGIPPSHISVTVNGIDTSLFSPEASDGGLRGELGIGGEEKVILSVSRLDEEAGYTAEVLCDIAEGLYERYPYTRIVIVGDGTIKKRLEDKVVAVNGRLKKDYIILTGARTDTHRFYAMSDVFAGISRSALEAMASGVPTVLAGFSGWLGRYGAEKDSECVKTNLTCRGYPLPTDTQEGLLDELSDCLSGGTDIQQGALDGVAFVKRYYSINRMSTDCSALYDEMRHTYGKYDAVITGYYGHGNAGDDTLLHSVLTNLRDRLPWLKLCVLAKNPNTLGKRLKEQFPNIDVKGRFDFLAVSRALRSSRSLIFGGGSLLQDNTSTKSLLYYLYLLNKAQKLGINTILYANGIGPINNPINLNRVKRTLCEVTLMTFRDARSYDMAVEMGLDKSRLRLTADEALTSAHPNPAALDALRATGRLPSGDYMCVCVRRWDKASPTFLPSFGKTIGEFCSSHSLIPVFLVMEDKMDMNISRFTASLTGLECAFVSSSDGIDAIIHAVSGASLVVSMRLHALVFAACTGTPLVGVSYDPKVDAFLKEIGMENENCEVPDFDSIRFMSLLEQVYSRRGEISAVLEKRVAPLREAAERNAQIVCELLEKQDDKHGGK